MSNFRNRSRDFYIQHSPLHKSEFVVGSANQINFLYFETYLLKVLRRGNQFYYVSQESEVLILVKKYCSDYIFFSVLLLIQQTRTGVIWKQSKPRAHRPALSGQLFPKRLAWLDSGRAFYLGSKDCLKRAGFVLILIITSSIQKLQARGNFCHFEKTKNL